MSSLASVYANGRTYAEMSSAADQNVELFTISRARAIAPEELAARVDAMGRRWHLLSVSEDWCGDSVNTLPWVDALAASTPLLDHRVIRRDEHIELMNAHLTNQCTRSIPIVLVLDDRFEERGWWGPRPRALQEWFESPVAQAMSKEERYKILRTRYARDRGVAIMQEIVTLIESVAAQELVGASTAKATDQAASQA